MKIKMVCSRCGSENIVVDSASRWNAEEQKWETVNVYDDGHSCGDCDSEIEIIEVEIE